MDQDDVRTMIREERPNATPRQITMFLRDNPEDWDWSEDDVMADLGEDAILAAFDEWCDEGPLE